MSYDIREEINNFLDSTDLTEPRAIATKLSATVPSHYLRVVLAEAMVSLVRDVIRSRRNLRPIPEVPATSEPVRGVRRPSQSTKRDLIAQAHEKRLRDLVYVGNGKRLQLGDCGYDNLAFIAGEYRDRAKENVTKAKGYEKLANALAEYSVDTVRALPREVFEQFMN